jgi:poly-gamma-glutamate capsule biosynthesis protein CapA/YwtB (metallophosphatase superfamily)
MCAATREAVDRAADMTGTIALAGDTMLGRGVAEALIRDRAAPLVSPEIVDELARADAVVLNLECCISDRGTAFADPRKPFFFRAPPVAAERLADLGVDAITLANNHALDYGPVALLDTLRHLESAGVPAVGAGADETRARASLVVRCGPLRLRVAAFSDHPAAYAAAPARPGIAYADLRSGTPDWARAAAAPGPDCDAVLVTPHWGPNMVSEPLRRVRRAADALVGAGATLVAGHSAHVFHGVAGRVLFDLGDFLDDYAVDRELRNDLGLLWLVDLSPGGPTRIRAVPLALDYCFTRRASAAEANWIERRLRDLCAPFGTGVERAGGMIEVHPGTQG